MLIGEKFMGRGIVAFLVLLAFVPSALHVLHLYDLEVSGVQETRNVLLEQQAITVREQDIEESFWRVAVYANGTPDNALDEWEKQMETSGVEIWYGDSGGPNYHELVYEVEGSFNPKMITPPPVDGKNHIILHGNKHDAIIARITVGNSTGIYLITQGCEREYP